MRLCLLTIPGRPDNPRLGFAGPNDHVLDANEAHATALAGHLDAKRAYELADALVPSDLYGFLRNGRHGWRALELAVEYLGAGATDTELVSPRGNRVVFRPTEVELRPALHRDPTTIEVDRAAGDVVRTPIGYGTDADRVIRTSYAMGGVEQAEYAAVVGRSTDGAVDDVDAWDYVAGFVKLTADSGWQGIYVHSVDELDTIGDTDLYCELADAISIVSRREALEPGDIVRTGTRRAGVLDLTANGNDVLERLLSHVER